MSARAEPRFSLARDLRQIFPPRALDASAATSAKRPLFDYWLLGLVALLLGIGLLMIFSVSFGPRVQGGDADPTFLFARHALWVGLGLVALVINARLDYHLYERFALPIMLGTLALLIGVLVFGNVIHRQVFNGSFQPGEVAKLVSLVYISAWLASKGNQLKNPVYGLIPFSLIVGLVAGLVGIEPNLSTALLIGVTALGMFFIASADLIQFGALIAIGGSFAALIISQYPRAIERLGLWMGDPVTATGDQFYQLRQALIAFGSGGWIGKGLLSGGGQYGWVPLAHSDAIFAIWGEETGLAGTLFLLAVFMFLFHRAFLIAARAPDSFGRLLASGIALWLFFQTFVHMGVIIKAIPFTGQPLPFISYGGSSMIMTLIGIGILFSIARGQAKPPAPRAKPKPTRAAPTEKSAEAATREKNATVTHRRWDRRTRVSDDRRPAVRPRARPRTRQPRSDA